MGGLRMLLCGVSDIHGDLNINIPECDVLCICGDVINLNDQRDIPASKHWWETRFVKWVESLPCKKVIVIPGNHDFYLERMYNECWGWFKDHMSLLSNKKLEFLIDESFYYEDIHFYGTPWINPISFQKGRWAFERNFNENPIEIPKCDVLLTHDNPYENENIRVSNSIATYHLFGHWHDGEDNPILCRFNCSILNDMYNRKKKFKCVIIKIEPMKNLDIPTLDYVIMKVKESGLFSCPKSNEIAKHNEGLLAVLESLKNEDGPVLEDTIPWEHPMETIDSTIITDFND